MKPTYKELEREIAELRQALTGRTVSCHACNQSAMERDMLRENIHEALEEIKELTKERDEVRAMMVTLCHRVAADAISEQAKAKPMPSHEFREATQQDVERLMNNPIIKDMKWKSVEDDTN